MLLELVATYDRSRRKPLPRALVTSRTSRICKAHKSVEILVSSFIDDMCGDCEDLGSILLFFRRVVRR